MAHKRQVRNGMVAEKGGIRQFENIDLLKLSESGIFRYLLLYIEVTKPGMIPHYYLAELLGVDRKTVQNIVNEKSHPTIDHLRSLAVQFPFVKQWIKLRFEL